MLFLRETAFVRSFFLIGTSDVALFGDRLGGCVIRIGSDPPGLPLFPLQRVELFFFIIIFNRGVRSEQMAPE